MSEPFKCHGIERCDAHGLTFVDILLLIIALNVILGAIRYEGRTTREACAIPRIADSTRTEGGVMR